jgi:hypothetical protein
MSPTYYEFPERRPELRPEVGKLFEAELDQAARAGKVLPRTADAYHALYLGVESLKDVQVRRGTDTKASNERDYFLPALLDGWVPAPPGIRRQVATRVDVWLQTKPLSDALRADFEAQLEELEHPTGAVVSRKPAVRPVMKMPAGSPRTFELPEEGTNRQVIAQGRKEQAKLRDHLLQGRTEMPCDLCGRVLPAQFLVAAHIVPRSDLNDNERIQFDRIAMVACVLGCDRLFESGFLTVDEEGMVWSKAIDGDLGPVLAELESRRCSAHTAGTAPAFAVHRATHS